MYPYLGQHLLYVYSFVNDLPEDGLKGPKHVGGPSQGFKYLWLCVQFVGLLLNTTDRFRMAFSYEGWT